MPLPDKTLDVYGIDNLNQNDTKSPKKSSSKPSKFLKTKVKTQKTLASKKSPPRSPSPPKTPPKPEYQKMPSPLNIDISALDPYETQDLSKISNMLDSKIQSNVSINTSAQINVTEEEIGNLLESYKEDMDLVYLVSMRVAKMMVGTLTQTNKVRILYIKFFKF